LHFGDEKFQKLEEKGVQEASKCAFVLVAGGLGERIGYDGPKVKLLHLFTLVFINFVPMKAPNILLP
jgi:UDP-N-acetylglucosamine pyrophosphorylase